MTHSRLRFEALIGIPSETAGNKIDEKFVIAFENAGKGLGSRTPSSTLGIDERTRRTGSVYALVNLMSIGCNKIDKLTKEVLTS